MYNNNNIVHTIFSYNCCYCSIVSIVSLQFSWDTLRQEFPCLHPVQLYHILTHYILPKGLERNNIPWAPSEEDARQIENKGK